MRTGHPFALRIATPRSRSQLHAGATGALPGLASARGRRAARRRNGARPAQVRLHLGRTCAQVVGMQVSCAPLGAPRAQRRPGRHAAQLLGALREEQLVGGQVPVPQAFVRAGDRERVALLRLAQPRAPCVHADEVAPHHRQQRDDHERDDPRAQPHPEHLLAPRGEHLAELTRHHHRHAEPRHRAGHRDAVEGVLRTGQQQHRVRRRIVAWQLAVFRHRPAYFRVVGGELRHQGVALAEQGNRRAALQMHGGVEPVEVGGIEQRGDHAIEAAAPILEAACQRHHPAAGCRRAHRFADVGIAWRLRLQAAHQRAALDVAGRGLIRHRAIEAHALRIGDEHGRYIAELVALRDELVVQGARVERRQRTVAVCQCDRPQHDVDGLQRAPRLLGEDARQRIDLARGALLDLETAAVELVGGADGQRDDEEHGSDDQRRREPQRWKRLGVGGCLRSHAGIAKCRNSDQPQYSDSTAGTKM